MTSYLNHAEAAGYIRAAGEVIVTRGYDPCAGEFDDKVCVRTAIVVASDGGYCADWVTARFVGCMFAMGLADSLFGVAALEQVIDRWEGLQYRGTDLRASYLTAASAVAALDQAAALIEHLAAAEAETMRAAA